MAGPGTLRALGSEGWGRLRPLLCWSPGMHTCEDMWQFPYGRMVHQTHFTARVVSACCASCRRLPHRTRALVWTLCPRPDTQPSMPEGLGPRVLSPSPLHTHTHSPSPVLGYASVITSYCSRSGYRLCSEHLRLRKILLPGPGWPSSPSITGPGLYGHPGRPQGSRSPEPSVHFSCTPCCYLAAPLGLSPCHSPLDNANNWCFSRQGSEEA